MHEDGMPNHAEYTVLQKAEGRYLHLRILFVCLYVLFVLSYAAAAIFIGIVQVIAILPILLWIFAHYTWRYVSVEHSIVICEGKLTMTDILKDGKKISRLTIVLSEAESLSKIPEKAPDCTVLHDFRGDTHADNAYCITYWENGKKAMLYLRTTPDLLRILKRFVKNSL